MNNENKETNINNLVNKLGRFFVDDIEISTSVRKKIIELVDFVSAKENITQKEAFTKIMTSNLATIINGDIFDLIEKNNEQLYEYMNENKNIKK